ncbi:hypothetical protein [Mesorhizobium muleiense]|uniref:hypothetical protein n=1 Tax=Mesorhizobium muleiense TaxID=1004279 RepID=UPI001F16BD31|nr:hypothetical protein [Mesorhizobium muleiense]MCF6112009.1 hypothetical protein [Mesorhizobium muleiense]
MGIIKDLGRAAWRKYVVDGVAASGFNKPDTIDIFPVFDQIDADMVNAQDRIGGLEATVAVLPGEIDDLGDRVEAVEGLASAGIIWTDQRIEARSVANVNLATGLVNGQILNGVTVQTGLFYFLGSQTLPAQNGIYPGVAAGTSARATFADSADELAHIGFVIQSGTVGTGERWTLPLDAADITVGTTALNFAQTGVEPGYAAEVEAARGSEPSLASRFAAQDLAIENTAATQARFAALRAALAAGNLPIGIIDLDAYGLTGWSNRWGVKLYSSGSMIWPMRKIEAGFRVAWREGDYYWTDPATSDVYASVSLAKMNDPTLQGVAFSTYYVNYATGNDINTGGQGSSEALPWKRLNYALATIEADAGVLVAEIFVLDEWVGSNSFPLTGYTTTKKIKITGRPPSGRQTKFLQVRESITSAGFNWTDNGDGSWTSGPTEDTVTISDLVRNAPANFDLSILDADGVPLPMRPAVDKATCQATPNTWFNEVVTGTSNDILTVHRADGAKPEPGVNWSYTEIGSSLTFNIEDGAKVFLENLMVICNRGAAGTPCIYARPVSVTAATWAEHTGEFYTRNVTVVGADAEGVQVYDMKWSWHDYLIGKYCRKDVLNLHTFHSFSVAAHASEGSYMSVGSFCLMAEHIGENYFKSQPALTTSNQSSSAHSQIDYTSLNEIGGYTNGTVMAHIDGAKVLLANPYPHDPTNAPDPVPVTAGASPRALFWCDGVNGAGATTKLDVLFGSGRIDGTGTAFVATNAGAIRAADWVGPVTTELYNAGTVTLL